MTQKKRKRHPWLVPFKRREIVGLMILVMSVLSIVAMVHLRRQHDLDVALQKAIDHRNPHMAIYYLKIGAWHPVWPQDYPPRHPGLLSSWRHSIDNMLHPVSQRDRLSDVLYCLMARNQEHNPEAAKAAQELIEMGADPNFQQPWKKSVLDGAEFAGDPKCIRVLIAHGARVHHAQPERASH